MKLSTAKKYRRKHKLLGALLLRNPVLVMGLDLPFVIAAGTSLKNAVAMTIQIFLIHTVTMLAVLLTRRRLPFWGRVLVSVTVSTATMMLAQRLILMLFAGISNSLGMYLYLMAVNSMTMLQASTMDREARLWPVLTSALGNALGFSVVVAVVSLLREYFGSGTLWGVAVPVPVRMSGLLIPFAGFIIMGFLLAFTRFANKKLLARSLRESARKEARYTKIHIDSVEIID